MAPNSIKKSKQKFNAIENMTQNKTKTNPSQSNERKYCPPPPPSPPRFINWMNKNRFNEWQPKSIQFLMGIIIYGVFNDCGSSCWRHHWRKLHMELCYAKTWKPETAYNSHSCQKARLKQVIAYLWLLIIDSVSMRWNWSFK